MKTPKFKVFEPSKRYKQIVVRALHFDTEALIVDVQGESFSFARVIFRNPIGFRVLDESDLCEFWATDVGNKNLDGWLYEVEEGGWMELETNRESFCSNMILGNKLHEYLLADYKCISVLSTQLPEIQDIGTTPD